MASLVQLDPPELTPAVTTASTPAMSAVSQNTVSGTLNIHDGRFQVSELRVLSLPISNREYGSKDGCYCTLANSMPISNNRDKSLVDVPAQVHSFLEQQGEFQKQ